MEQSLFNFNALTIALSSLPPLSSQSRTIQSYCQGVTRVQLTYKDLFFTNSTIFSSINPFKLKLDWDLAKGGDATTVINDVYAYDSTVDIMYILLQVQCQKLSPGYLQFTMKTA